MASTLLASTVYGQLQMQKLRSSDGQRGDEFGFCAALDGDWAAIGAPGESSIAVYSGAIYLFRRQGTIWTETQKLKASVPVRGTNYGYSASLSGGVLAAGEAGTNTVHVYEAQGDVWSLAATLHPPSPHAGDSFGDTVWTNGERILIGADGDGEAATDAGAVYVFDRAGTTWTQTTKLMCSDASASDSFGSALSCSGESIVVGAPLKNGPGGADSGAAYVFENDASGWHESQKLVPADASAGDLFGIAVAHLNGHILIAADGKDTCAPGGGGIYTFTKESSWVQHDFLCTSDPSNGDSLGARLSATPQHLVAGSNFATTGSAYDFRSTGDDWIQAGKLLSTDIAFGDNFGCSISISGEAVLVGASSVDDVCPNDHNCDSGAAFFFELAPTAVQYGHCPSGAPCNNVDSHGGCRNSTGQGAILSAGGSGSTATDDLRLGVTHCPPNKLTLLFMGGGQVHTPFADGIRVVGGGGIGVFRFGGLAADPQGTALRGPGLIAQSQGFHNANGHIEAGATWNFQVWYRDTAGPCGGLTNYSNGVQVAFTP